MRKVTIEYSEDFRENKVAPTVYAALRDGGFDPIAVTHQYIIKLGMSRVEFDFGGHDLPSQSQLEEKLKELKLGFVKIKVQGSQAHTVEL